MKHLCSYCGGFDDGKTVDEKHPDATWTAFNIDWNLNGIELKKQICIRCFEKGLDKLLTPVGGHTNVNS